MEEWAEKLLEEHKNPIVKLDFSRKKVLQPEQSGQLEYVNQCLQMLKSSIDTNRVEKRCARSKLKWVPEKHLAVALNLMGSVINSYGYQDKSGKYFYPEEALFLLETNKVEIIWNDVPMSIQQAYEVIIDNVNCDLNNYRAYKNLRLDGHRVLRPRSKSGNCHKRFKKSDEAVEEESNSSKEFFLKLQESGPKENTDKSSDDDSCPFFVYKSEKKSIPDLKLKFMDTTINPDIGYDGQDVPNIYCFLHNDSASYFQCSQINIPSLI